MDDELKAQVTVVLDANPDLTNHGIGTPDHDLRYFVSGLDREAEHRAFYNVKLEHVARVIEWLKPLARTQKINRHARQLRFQAYRRG
jgi:hypothetical protein